MFEPTDLQVSLDTPQISDTGLNPTPSSQDVPVSLDAQSTDNYLLSPEVIRSRSFKASYGLRNTPAFKPQGDFNNALSAGLEDQARTEAAMKLDSSVLSNRFDLMQKVSSALQGPLTPDHLKQIDVAAGYNFPFTYPTNPKGVFEQNYAKEYTSELDRFAIDQGSTNFWNVAKNEVNAFGHIKNDQDATKYFGTIVMAQDQYMLSKMQNIKSIEEKQGWVPWMADFAKMAFPIANPYYEIKARGNVEGVSAAEGILLNKNLKAQEMRLKSLPWDQFTAEVDKIAEIAKDNPQAALAVLQQLRGQSGPDEVLNALNTIGHAADVVGVLKFGQSIFSKLALRAQVRRAVQNVIVAEANPEVSKANILASVGNLPEAAIEDASPMLTQRIAGSSSVTQQGLEELSRFFSVHRENLANDSSLSETRRNILLEQARIAEDSIINAAANSLRPDIIPLEQFSKETLRKIEKDTIGRYPGLSNSVVRLSDIFVEPLSRRPFQTYWIGRNAGEFFGDVDEAFSHAHANGLRITYNAEQLADLDARIGAMRGELKDLPLMHDDAAGLNYSYQLETRIKDLEARRELVSKKGGDSIGQSGLGFHIEITKPVNVFSKIITKELVDENRTTSVSPRSWTNFIPYFSYLRTAEDTMSAELRAARKPPVYGQSVFMALAHEEGQYINNVLSGKQKFDAVTGERLPWYKQGIPLYRRFAHKDERNAFLDTLKYSQDNPNPIDGIEGHYFETYHDLNDHYLRMYNRSPTAAETYAYFANSRWAAQDWIWRNINEYRSRAQLGADTHVISTTDKTGQVIKSPEFDGISQNTFPRSSTGNVLIIGGGPEDTAVKYLPRMSNAVKEEWDKAIASGEYRAIKIYNTEDRPFNGFVKGGENNVEYVVAKNVESTPLKWNQVARRGGGHQVYDYDWYIKQAIIRTERVEGLQHRYEGDETLYPVKIRAMGQQYTERLNDVRRLLLKGDEAGAEAMFRDSNLPGTYGELKSMFFGYKDKQGVNHPPRFNLTEDFHVVPKNRSIIEMNNDLQLKYKLGSPDVKAGQFIDGTREGNPARNFQTAFTGQRDARGLFAVNNTGTPQRPSWELVKAEKVSPLETQNRSLQQIIRSSLMDDYKQAAVRAWLQEVKPYLKPTPAEVDSSPFYYFKTASYDMFKPGPQVTDPQKLDLFMANHFKINQLVGTPSKWDTFLHSISQNLADQSYLKFGKSIIPQWLLHTTEDPFSFIRSVTFNAYLGLFSIPQIFVQMASFVNIHAISPTHAPAGSLATMLHGWSRFNQNPRILAALDDLATKIKMPGLARWKPGEWTEAMQALDKTGFANVAGEYGPLDTLSHAKVISSGFDKFLSWGAAPFRFGERAVRLGAWYTAFKEFRDINPVGALRNSDLVKILDRADFLYGNMSSASNSTLHTGILSLPTQFYAYNLRLAELFFSKRVSGGLGDTVAERALARSRIVAVNAAMFGVPMAFGVSGLPIGDYLRQTALDNGYNVGEKWIQSLLMEGLPSTPLALATGKHYDIGQRYGLGGFTQIRQALQSDAPFWQIIGGASASLTMNTWNGSDGLWQAMKALVRQDTHQFPLKMENWVDLFKEVQSVNKAYSLYVAIAAGKWINKNAQQITDVTPLNALFMTATGLTSQGQADVHNISANLKTQQEYQKFAVKQATMAMNRAIMANRNNDFEQGRDFFTQAMTRLYSADLRPDQIASVVTKVLKDKSEASSLIDDVAYQRYIKNATNDPKRAEVFRQSYGHIRKQLQQGNY